MIPRKIYLRENELKDQFMCERMVSCDASIGSCNVEYIDISQVWHDATEEPEGANCKILCHDKYERFWSEKKNMIKLVYKDWNTYTEIEGVIRWAYISDLLPKY